MLKFENSLCQPVRRFAEQSADYQAGQPRNVEEEKEGDDEEEEAAAAAEMAASFLSILHRSYIARLTITREKNQEILKLRRDAIAREREGERQQLRQQVD